MYPDMEKYTDYYTAARLSLLTSFIMHLLTKITSKLF